MMQTNASAKTKCCLCYNPDQNGHTMPRQWRVEACLQDPKWPVIVQQTPISDHIMLEPIHGKKNDSKEEQEKYCTFNLEQLKTSLSFLSCGLVMR